MRSRLLQPMCPGGPPVATIVCAILLIDSRTRFARR